MRYLGNNESMVVHDLNNEQTNCQIGEILTEHRVGFTPDTLAEAQRQGYRPCEYCVG